MNDIEKAANEYIRGKYSPWLYRSLQECFIAGAEWMEKRYEKVEGESEGWFEHYDHEFMCGFRFDEPVGLPCDVYIKRKEE